MGTKPLRSPSLQRQIELICSDGEDKRQNAKNIDAVVECPLVIMNFYCLNFSNYTQNFTELVIDEHGSRYCDSVCHKPLEVRTNVQNFGP